MKDEDLKLNIGEPTLLDKAIMMNREKPLTAKELKGFGKLRPKPRQRKVYPFIKVSMPSKEDGPKGKTVMVGIKGTF